MCTKCNMERLVSMVKHFIVDAENAGKSVRHLACQVLGVSGKLLKKLRDQNLIQVNGIDVRTTQLLCEGDDLSLDIGSVIVEQDDGITPVELPLSILYEDDYLIAIDKPAGIVVHPSAYHPENTIANALVWYYRQTGQRARIHPVSRLDRDTTGIILFAKDAHTVHQLFSAHKSGSYAKVYYVLAQGVIEPPSGIIDLPIARKPDSIMLRTVREHGAAAQTFYETLHCADGISFLRVYPITGKTHQIRVHFAAVGHPLLNDGLYGNGIISDRFMRTGQALHSAILLITHPVTQLPLRITAPLPQDFQDTLATLGKHPLTSAL